LVTSADIVGIGYPIYGSDAPEIIKSFTEELPIQKNPKKMMIYVTQLAWSGDGASFMRHALRKQGYDLKWAVEFNMPNNISVPVFPALFTSDYSKFQNQLIKSEQRAKKLVDKIVCGIHWIMGANPLAAAAAWMQRAPYRHLFNKTKAKTWSVDAEKCTGCRRCEQICPLGNIQMKNSIPVYGDQCNFCMRCYNYCPELAVLAYHKSHNPERTGLPYQGPVPQFKPELITRSGK